MHRIVSSFACRHSVRFNLTSSLLSPHSPQSLSRSPIIIGWKAFPSVRSLSTTKCLHTEKGKEMDYFIPEPPAVPFQSMNESINALGEPTFSSLGLNSWWPHGWVQNIIEILHVNCGLSWCACIAIISLAVRLFLLPVWVKSKRDMTKFTHTMTNMQELMANINDARMKGNILEMMLKMKDYEKLSSTVSPWAIFKMPLIQLPIVLSIFMGLKKMAALPVVSMQTGGLWWFTDLTIPDPYFIMPIMTATSLFLMFEFGTEITSSKMMLPTQRNLVRALPFMTLLFTVNMPAALTFYWSVGNVLSITQYLILSTKPVKAALNLPDDVASPGKVNTKSGFFHDFEDRMKTAKAMSYLLMRQKTEHPGSATSPSHSQKSPVIQAKIKERLDNKNNDENDKK